MESNVNSISTVSDGSSGIDIDSSLPSSSSSSFSYQRYDIQNLARWIEHVHPFSLLLLLVFVCQHLQGGESVLIGITVMLKLYWACSNANCGGVFADIVSCLVANTCLASFLFKERIWKLFFITNHRVIFNRQADNSSMEAITVSNAPRNIAAEVLLVLDKIGAAPTYLDIELE
ncbi:hypothetical protein NC653_041942 [Populus alba x Populus x berolinensis]|uniref:Uncharacterized protein n=1 Tax=Populus alba x Populus x berolinensis TaxID=444605 RepID=A0AAD6L9R7_9ROSI|nr:hypothetical protein NC653_041942 [Populus alba x Populus x berolinensis]